MLSGSLSGGVVIDPLFGDTGTKYLQFKLNVKDSFCKKKSVKSCREFFKLFVNYHHFFSFLLANFILH